MPTATCLVTASYTYDSANRLKTMTGASVTANYAYNGLGDRLQETVNGVTTTFTMDLNTGLTQALSDGTNTYIYGLGRIAQTNATTTDYFLGDALGSVRQLTNASGAITYSRAYDPYGVVTATSGSSSTTYGYTGAVYDTYIKLIYLRSRMYSPLTGRFTTKDSWQGDYNRPLSLNRFNYVEGNPVNYTDHSGQAVDTQPSDCLWGYIIGTDGVIICNIITYSHHYVISTVVCPFYLFCSRTEMVDFMSRFAFPGQRVNEPVLVDRNDSVAPFGWFKNHPDIYGDGAIRVQVYNGGLTTKNITKKTHIFYEGNVVRTGSQDWNDAWRVNTDGSGQNSSAFIALVNQFAGRQIFVEVDEAMKVYILSKKVPAHLRSLGDLLINFQCEIKEYQSSQ